MAIVSLPWYDLPEIRHATDAFWRAVTRELNARGIDFVPDVLERELHHTEQWVHPKLMFTQACGYDVAVDHAVHLRVVAAPCFMLPGCDALDYSSYVLVRNDGAFAHLADLRGSVCAINNETSHSGTNALRAMIAPFSRGGKFFRKVIVSGGHTHSLKLLQDGLADVICVDCVTYGLLQRNRPSAVAGSRVLARTPSAPAPPFVTSMRYGRVFTRKLQKALVNVLNDDGNDGIKKDLCLGGVALVDNGIYDRVLEFEAIAAEHGYFELPAPKQSMLRRLQMRSARE